MAKKKLNVKLLAVVFGLVGIGVVVVGGLLLVQFRNDPVKHIRKADALMAEGNVNAALKQYGRGIGKAPYQMEYYDKMLDALVTLRPETVVERRSRFQTLLDLQLQRAEMASDSEGATAKENQAASARAALDNLSFYPWVNSLASNAENDFGGFERVSTMLRGLDKSIERMPVADRDPRVAAEVRACVVEPLWRKGRFASKSAWRDDREDIVEAIEVDPTYVPTQFGLLHATLSRIDESLSGGTSLRAVKREITDPDGFDAAMAAAREAIGDQPAPELDLLEQNRDYIGFLAGVAGSEKDDVTAEPDADAIRDLSFELGDVSTWEKRYRLELIRMLLLDMLANNATADVNRGELSAYQIQLNNALRRVVQAQIEMDDQDYRALILAIAYELEQIGDLSQDEVFDAIRVSSLPTVGVNAMLYRELVRIAVNAEYRKALKSIALSFADSGSASEQALDRLKRSYDAVLEEFPPSMSGARQLPELEATLTFNTVMGRVAEDRGDENAKRNSFREASRALNLARNSPEMRLNAISLLSAIEVAQYFNQAGLALDLYQKTLQDNPELAQDFKVRFQLVKMLFDSGRMRDAEAYSKQLADDIAAAEASGIAVDEILKTEVEMAVNDTTKINTGGVIEALPGADILAAEQQAAYLGDVSERRRLLDRILEEPDGFNEVVIEQAALRRAALEATQGDFDQAKVYASRVLESNPDAQAAKLIMRSDETTSILDRARIISELSNDNRQDQDVAIIRSLNNFLGSSVATRDPEEIELLKAERDRLLDSVLGAEEKRADALRLLTERAINRGETDVALEYIDQIEAIDGGQTPISLVLRATSLSESDQTAEAINLIEDAIENLGFGDDQMYNLYADLLTRQGDTTKAMVQYERAFEIAPNRPRNALNYAQALIRAGNDAKALEVFRLGKKDGRRVRAYRDIWLGEEVRAGNSSIAIEERSRRLQLDPTDFINAIELAVLLSESMVDRPDIVYLSDDPRRGHKAGEEVYSASQWSRLSPDQRGQIIQDYRMQRSKMAEGIFEQLLTVDSIEPSVVVGASRFYVARDMPGRAEEILKSADESLRKIIEDGGNSLLTENEARDRLARILAERGMFLYRQNQVENREAMIAYFDQAAEVESEFSGVADVVIVTFLGSIRDFENAIRFQKGLLREFVENDRADREISDIARSLIELQVISGDVSGAKEVAEEFLDVRSSSPSDQRVLGQIALGQAEQLRKERGSSFKLSAVGPMLDTADFHFQEAARMEASNLRSAAMAAAVTEFRWRWADESEQDEYYRDLIGQLRAIVEIDESNWPAREALVTALRQGMDKDLAVSELRDFLTTNQTNKRARIRLIQLLEERENLREAIEVAETGFNLAPNDFDWAAILGELRANAKQFDEAAVQFSRLYEQSRDPKYLNSQVRFLLDRDPPAADKVVDLARENSEYFSKIPYLIGAYSVALTDLGRRSEGLDRFQTAYRTLRNRSRELPQLAIWLSRLFPNTLDGAKGLQLFTDEISDNDPDTVALLELSVMWQRLFESGVGLDEEQRKEAQMLCIEALRRGIEANTDRIGVLRSLLRLGTQLDSLDDCDGATEAFERGLEIEPENPELLNNLAYLGAQCGDDLFLAMDRSQKSVESKPSEPQFRDTLGTILLRIARLETDPDARADRLIAAERELRKAIKYSDGNAAYPWIHLAELKVFQGDPKEARIALREASRFDLNAEQKSEIDQVLSELDGQ